MLPNGLQERHCGSAVPRRTKTVLLALTLVTIGLALPPASHAASGRRVLDLSVQPMADISTGPGPVERALGRSQGLRGRVSGDERPELAIRAGALGLALRSENDRLKPDLFYDVSGWRLRTRIMSGDSPLEIDGMLLRAAHSFPLFGHKMGTADLP